MSEINLKKGGSGRYIIDTPAGKKITASMLEEGKYYIKDNMCLLLRFIVEIDHEENIVYYEDMHGLDGNCSKEQFARNYRYEATDTEVDFMIDQWNSLGSHRE